jgi:DtxR family Mn-dependent transcriptional regulator
MSELTDSMQHYLKAIYELSSEGEGVRVSDIAARLNVTKASSCIAMKNLQQKRMIYRNADRLVFLTKEGEYQAILALDKAAIIRRFLTDVLGVKHETADADACAIEHVISVEALCSLCRYTNQKCAEGCYVITDSAPLKTLFPPGKDTLSVKTQ